METLGRKAVKHNPWFIFSLWVILIAIGMLEAWAILLQGKDYPIWKYVLILLGILIVGLFCLYGMFVSAKKLNRENQRKVFHQRIQENDLLQ